MRCVSQRLEADYRNHEQMKSALMQQQRQLNDCLLVRHHRPHQQHLDDAAAAAFGSVVVVTETTDTRGSHVTSITQCLNDLEETDSNATISSSDNGLCYFSVVCLYFICIVICSNYGPNAIFSHFLEESSFIFTLSLSLSRYYSVLCFKKRHPFIFLNNSVTHQLIFIRVTFFNNHNTMW